jgi:hypothetical protein
VKDVNPLICIRGSASPGHSYPMTPLYVKNTGDSPMQVTFSANPGYAMSWLKVSPVEILPGDAASIPLTLMVPPNAHPGEDYAILTAGGVHFDVRFSVGVPPPRKCLAAGYKPDPGTSAFVFLWLIVPVVIILMVFWLRSRTNGVRLGFAADPRRHRPDPAGALHGMGLHLSQLNQWGDARPVYQEAVGIYRGLAGVDPDSYRPVLDEASKLGSASGFAVNG